MGRHIRRLRRTRRLLGLAVLAVGTATFANPAPAAALSTWTGTVNVYGTGVFTTQATWQFCTAADVQMMRNMVFHRTDHSSTNQSRYFWWMRSHNRYTIPVSDGVDPQGWRDGLRNWVDSRYTIVSTTSFLASIRSAVRSLRLTNRPVGLLVAHGNHAWILNGFSATADPAVTSSFRITAVWVTGPLWGLQSRTYGYDMRPNRKLFPYQLDDFWTPWHYAGTRMVWEGRFVAIQAAA